MTKIIAKPDHEKAVFGFADCEEQARALAHTLKVPYTPVNVHTFPDRESLVRIKTGAKEAILYRPLHHPNSKLFDILLAFSALRDLGAEKNVFVIPYLPYMRQDKVFHKGEALSQKVFGQLISPFIDKIVTVEPHLHRTHTLETVFPGVSGITVSGAGPLADYFRKNDLDRTTFVIGPDEEAWRIAKPFAKALGLEWTVASKNRQGDRDVRVEIKEAGIKDRPVLIIDDVISTGMTVVDCARTALKMGAKLVNVATVHALFDKTTMATMEKTGITSVVSCDGVPHSSNKVELAPFLTKALS